MNYDSAPVKHQELGSLNFESVLAPVAEYLNPHPHCMWRFIYIHTTVPLRPRQQTEHLKWREDSSRDTLSSAITPHL